MTNRKKPEPTIAPKALQERVRELLKTKSVVEVAKHLGIGREAVTRIAGGLGVKAGTIAQAEKA